MTGHESQCDDRRRYRIAADTTLGVVFTEVTVGRNVKRQVLRHMDAVRYVAVAHKLPEREVTEVIEVVWLNGPDGEVVCV